MEGPDRYSLLERKQRRTRDAIIEAALHLFDQRGFDAVTVTEIAQQAEVGRSTFFRYFADKAEVLYADTDERRALLIEASSEAAKPFTPLGNSLHDALTAARAGVIALGISLSERHHWLPIRARLIAKHPELQARELLKQQTYIAAGIEALIHHGCAPDVATLAAHLAAACYAAAHHQTVTTGRPLPDTVADSFALLLGQLP